MYHSLSDFYGKKIALLLHFVNENKEPAAALVKGTAFFQDGYLRLHRGSSVPPVAIPLKLVWRAKPVGDEFRDILGDADYLIEGSVAELQTLPGGKMEIKKSA